MAKKMLIDATHPEETRVVVMDGTKVDEFDFESINKRQLAGNIYLAKVTRVEPSLQAAFVEYGGNRHGFLAFSEIHPDYYQIPVADREALLAEEEEAEADADAEEEPKKPKRASSRSRSRSKSGSKPAKADAATDAATTTDPAKTAEADAGDAPAEAAADAVETAAPEAETKTKTTETAVAEEVRDEPPAAVEDPSPEPETAAAEESEADAGKVRTTEVDTPADAMEAAKDDDGEAPGGDEADVDTPRTIAESAGAEDDESVSEPVADAAAATERAPEDGDVATAEAPAETATDEPKQKRSRSRGTRSRSRRPKVEEEAEQAEAETVADPDAEEGPGEVESVGAEKVEDEVRPRRMKSRRYKIQEVIKVRQILLVQVVKEERGNKGAALTTYLSLAGRYCVLMPNTARGGGISRKITQAADRKKLKEIAGELEVPRGMGLIIRTAGAKRTKTEIKRDYEFLLRQWDQVRELTLQSIAPALIYEEGSLIKRSIRDLYGRDIDTILVEGDDAYREAKDYMKMLMPSHAKNVKPYKEATPLFSKFQVESFLAAMFNPTVQLKSGGYIVIGVTEALVAIDVNSGRSTREHSIEETALKTNLEAADEIARQLRLRDLAGLIVIDFIDMDENRNNRAVEKRIKDRLKDDRARLQIGRISSFGLMEMSRQRLRPGMLEATTAPCPHCHGTGIVRSADNVALAILREIEEEAVRRRSHEVKVAAPVPIANFLINNKRAHITSIEARYGIDIVIEGDVTLISPEYKIEKLKGQARPSQRHEEVKTVSAETAFEAAEAEEADEPDTRPTPRPAPTAPSSAEDDDDERGGGKKKRRRGKRGGRKRKRSDDAPEGAGDGDGDGESQGESRGDDNPLGEVIDVSDGEADDNLVETQERTVQKPKRPRPPRRKPAETAADSNDPPADAETPFETAAETEPEAAPEPAMAAKSASEPTAETVAETVAEEKAPEAEATPDEAPAEAPEPEPVAAEPERAAPSEPEKPKKKRFGWWS